MSTDPWMDDRFEWVETTTHASHKRTWTKGACRHRDEAREPVDTVTGELVRWLCTDCGTEWDPDEAPWPVPADMWRPVPPAPVPAAPKLVTEAEIIAGGYLLHRRKLPGGGWEVTHGDRIIARRPDSWIVSYLREVRRFTKVAWPVYAGIIVYWLTFVINGKPW